MEKQMELHELRLNRLEQLTTSMVDSQATMVQLLQDHSNRLDRIEKMQQLILDDLAFIKEILLREK